MEFTARASWLVAHLGLGALFLHSFAAGLAGLGIGTRPYSLLAVYHLCGSHLHEVA